MPRSPLDSTRPTAHGAYGFRRTDPNLCAGKPAPCTHYGVDIGGRQGTTVYAPERGLVVVSRPVLYKRPDRPFTNYHPGVVLLHGDSGLYHLLAHVRPKWNNLQPDVEARDAGDDVESALRAYVADARNGRAVGVWVDEGDVIGDLAGLNRAANGVDWNGHVHWEIRTTPLASDRAAQTSDPLAWLAYANGDDAPVYKRAAGGSSWLLLAALGLAMRYWRG